MTVNVHFGDCLPFIKTLKDNSIDMILTDPPYFLKNLDNNWSPINLQKKKSNSHIAKLPIGMKFDPKQGKKFRDFMYKLSQELYRVLKPGGFFISFSSVRLYHNMTSGIEDAGFHIRDSIAWTFSVSQVKAFRQNHIIDKDKKLTDQEKENLKEKLKNHRTPQLKSNFEMACVAMKPIEGRFIDNIQKWGTGLIYIDPNSKFPLNVMRFEKPNAVERKDNPHPTVKPVALMENLIDIFCPENGTVLDPFLGSGTCLIAALNKKRNCIGAEINKEYIDIIKKRANSIGYNFPQGI
jgi:site-specific DNA-methyltransferase (adenine-specific)